MTRNHNKVVPKIVQQQEMQNEQQALSAKDTVNVAVLQNDPDIKNLVAILYYNSKPVYLLTAILENATWTTMEKRVFNSATSQLYDMKILRLNFVD